LEIIINNSQIDAIITEVKNSVSNWDFIANNLDVSKLEQNLMSAALRY